MKSLLLALFLSQAPADVPLESLPPPEGEYVVDSSTCTKLIQTFKGMNLVEARIDYQSFDAKLVYLSIISRHKAVLFLVVRKGCEGNYQIVKVHAFDPNPRECTAGSECL